MRKTSILSIATVAIALALAGPVSAQQKAAAFDGQKFFEELQSRGFSSPAGFDGKKFFEEQSKTGGYAVPPMVDMTKM